MPRPLLLLTGASYYHQGWLEEHWPRLLERCEIKLTELSSGPEWLDQIAFGGREDDEHDGHETQTVAVERTPAPDRIE